MAGVNILDLVEATEVSETNDYLAVVDTSDTTQDTSGSTKKITVGNFLSGMLDWFYPVGTIYETTSSDLDTVEKVNAHFGGTWEIYGAGRVLVAKSADTEFDTIGKTGGEKTHTLTIAEMPSHNHNSGDLDNAIPTRSWGSGLDRFAIGNVTGYPIGTIVNKGGDQAHNNLQPYIVVYRYRRTA